MDEKLEIMKSRKGFIAALDQSGGSSKKTLDLYGIAEDQYHNDLEMFDLIHKMRSRIITSKSFSSDQVLGVILFEETMNRKIENEFTASYLWSKKHILSFLKVDKGLEDEKDGVQLMRPIPDLLKVLDQASKREIFGTKMRSVIHDDDVEGIQKVVEQQFTLAKTIGSKGFVPIIEPEVSIHSKNKEKCEQILKAEIEKALERLPKDIQVIFKFTIPSIPDFYKSLMNYSQVVRIVALSGGYKKEVACQKLSQNHGMIASFSRALLEGLQVSDGKRKFDQKLKETIDEIYHASIL
ncbi:MAG: fructose bisphosphate aldolase [Bacilli bacterium]|nr:fructose bisphosphate aldolase [Bacilli bacterium]